MKTIQKTEQLPVSYETDVIVVGGGPAGLGAAFSAAKAGLSVLIVEQTNSLGGIATSGLHGHICTYASWGRKDERVVGGTCYALAQGLLADGVAEYDGSNLDFEVEGMKLWVEREIQKYPKVKVLYYTQFSDVVMDGSSIQYVIIQNKSGRQAVAAKYVVDATGDADVSAQAGVPFEKGREGDGLMQPMTLMFQIGGLDMEEFEKFRETGFAEKYGEPCTYGLERVWEEAQANGDMEPFQKKVMGFWYCKTRPDQMGINFTHITHVDATNAEDLTYATMEGRRQGHHTVEVFRKYLPGFENSWYSHSAAMIGTRESRRIEGLYRITAEDLRREAEFPDSIGYGSFFIDIHNCSGAGMDQDTRRPHQGFKYQIPYRALLPKTVDNLIVAGRCISCDHIALGSLRVMPQCFVEGDAAGAACGIAAQTGKLLREIDIRRLQDILRQNGGIVFAEDIQRDE